MKSQKRKEEQNIVLHKNALKWNATMKSIFVNAT